MQFRLFAAPALVVLALLITGASGRADITALPAYTIIDLGTLGGETSEAFAINDSGATVGVADLPAGPAHAFRYNGALPIDDLAGLGASLYSDATGINAAGVIVGTGSPGVGNRVIVWNGGAAFVPSPFASINSFGYAINDLNTIVGNFALPPFFRPQAMSYSLGSATFSDIGALLAPLGGTLSVAVDVNASNVAAGWMGINFVVPTRAFRFTPPAQVELLQTFGLYDDIPTAINDDGLIVGRCGVGPGAQHACFWAGAAPLDINPAGAEFSSASGVNNKGEIVGISVVSLAAADGYAFLRTNGQTLNLNELIAPGSGWQLINANAINAHSQIAGAGLKDGVYHAFLLTPTTMPGANVVSTPIESATGTTPVKLTFDQITQGGVSTVTAASSGPPPPAGFAVGSPAVYYEISTTASFTGFVQVCVDVAGVDFGGTTPELFHYESASWVAVPSTLDAAANTVCGSVTSLSPFAVFRRLQVATYRIHELYDTTRAARRGSTLPVKFEVQDSLGNNVSSPALVVTALRTEQLSTQAPGEPIDSGHSNPDAAFRYDASLVAGGGYIFNLSTSELESGTYLLVFTIGGSPVEYSIRFQIK
jgi:probable HAF family extracellular repeat protein